MFYKYLKEIRVNVPTDFLINHLVGSFAETVKYWINNKMQYSPEEIADYYMLVIQA